MKDRSPILHTPPFNVATCVKILLSGKIAYKRNNIYRVRVKRGLPLFMCPTFIIIQKLRNKSETNVIHLQLLLRYSCFRLLNLKYFEYFDLSSEVNQPLEYGEPDYDLFKINFIGVANRNIYD
jgi:hypothetical protein